MSGSSISHTRRDKVYLSILKRSLEMWWKSPRKKKSKDKVEQGREETIAALTEETTSYSEGVPGAPKPIDLSLNGDDGTANQSPQSMISQPTFSHNVHRTQYNVSNYSILEEAEGSTEKTRDHRVPLLGRNAQASIAPVVTHDETLSLLRVVEPADEKAHVQEELSKLEHEIAALEDDKARLKRLSIAHDTSSRAEVPQWDVNRVLATGTINLGIDQKVKLQSRRGNTLSVTLHNERARKDFCQTCHYFADTNGDFVKLNKESCSPGGAACSVQRIVLMDSSSTGLSFLISRDHGKAHHFGHLPERLFRRMQRLEQSTRSLTSDLIYLAVGPLESYYAEFRNGEIWWGSPAGDNDFHTLCSSWEIKRVAFGSTSCIKDGSNELQSSWILIGHDGRVAWKNIPTRLHNLLNNRLGNEAAPEEVSLGPGNSYFIRFLDSSVDYCLPAKVASKCRELEASGSEITNIYMHPNLSHDFVIRSTD